MLGSAALVVAVGVVVLHDEQERGFRAARVGSSWG